MDVDLGTVPIEQARIARHSIRQMIGMGAFGMKDNYRAAWLMYEWIDWRIDRAEFLSLFVEVVS